MRTRQIAPAMTSMIRTMKVPAKRPSRTSVLRRGFKPGREALRR